MSQALPNVLTLILEHTLLFALRHQLWKYCFHHGLYISWTS